jgi:AAA+ ATPase superfamily predicted ATPase
MEKLIQAYGNWVIGEERFWDREREIELFIKSLDEGAHLHLIAQRRIGKTSLMREVSRRIEDRYICLHVDLQKAQTAEDLMVEDARSVWQYLRESCG